MGGWLPALMSDSIWKPDQGGCECMQSRGNAGCPQLQEACGLMGGKFETLVKHSPRLRQRRLHLMDAYP